MIRTAVISHRGSLLLAAALSVVGFDAEALAQRLQGGIGSALGEPGSAIPRLPELSPGPLTGPTFVLPPISPPPAQPPSDDGLRVLVREVRIEGNTVLPAPTIDEITAPFVGRKVGASDLEELRRRLSEAYVARG